MSNDDDVLRQQGPGSGLSRREALRRSACSVPPRWWRPRCWRPAEAMTTTMRVAAVAAPTTTGGGRRTARVAATSAPSSPTLLGDRPERQERQGRRLHDRQRAGPHRQRLVLRQDHEPRHRPRRQAHRRRGRTRTSRSSTRTTSRATRRPACTAINELGAEKVPAKLASYVDDLGAMFAGTEQFKIFTLDGGGGTSELRPGPSTTSGAPGPSRPTTPCPACSCTSRRSSPTPRPSA